MWLTSLKIAIVEKNVAKLDELIENIPQLEKEEDIHQAIYLLKEAIELMFKLKDETAVTMAQLKKNMNFLRSTQTPTSNRLDVKS